ncbi:MAG: MaoC family dehydratase [Acidimicrobiales bacterium]
MTNRQTTATVIDLADLPSHAGEVLGHSSWRTVTQDEVTAFARLTGDEQWIHVDPERAASGPFGTTVAHGYFTLALSTVFLYEVVEVAGAGLILNYGSDRVRYPAPLRVGSQIRALIELAAVKPLPGGFQTTYRLTYEVEGQAKPGCVAEIVFHYYTDVPGGSKPGGS